MYLGKWHSSEVAVKCLNPSLFFAAGDPNSNVAILDLLREADLLGSLRHPNVVWVYGIVLPSLARARRRVLAGRAGWAGGLLAGWLPCHLPGLLPAKCGRAPSTDCLSGGMAGHQRVQALRGSDDAAARGAAALGQHAVRLPAAAARGRRRTTRAWRWRSSGGRAATRCGRRPW